MNSIFSTEPSVVDIERVRLGSKGLLGNRYRLEIATAIAGLETDLFHAKELADGLGVPHNVVSQQVKAFVLAGICADVPNVAGQRFRYFRREPSTYWKACHVLMTELARTSIR